MKRKSTDRVQIGLRIRESLRARLETAAKRSDISINEEIGDRLERSFDRQDLLVDSMTLAFGRRLAGLLMVMGRAMQDAGKQGAFAADLRSNGENWMDEPFAYNQAAIASLSVLDKLKPDGKNTGPNPRYAEIFKGGVPPEHIGIAAATALTGAIKGKAPPDLRRWAAIVRELLEPEEDDE